RGAAYGPAHAGAKPERGRARADPGDAAGGAGAADGRRGGRRADRGAGGDQREDGAQPSLRTRREGTWLAKGDPCQGRVRGGPELGCRTDRWSSRARSRPSRSRPYTPEAGIWTVY